MRFRLAHIQGRNRLERQFGLNIAPTGSIIMSNCIEITLGRRNWWQQMEVNLTGLIISDLNIHDGSKGRPVESESMI